MGGHQVRSRDTGDYTKMVTTSPTAQPVTLRGSAVVLQPLELEHVDALTEVGLDPELWRWIPSEVATRAQMEAYVAKALEEQQRGVALPFVIVAPPGARLVGSPRYGNTRLANRRLEIGWTWVTASHQRTAVNTETKLLLL